MSTHDQLLARRRAVLRDARLSYGHPFQPTRGDGVWLFDASGRKYLDAYNNVPHVGHCHPRVVSAVAAQAALLNANTRYLDEMVVTYAERLVETMGDPLSAVIFTCTASEANDLAFRIAASATGRRGVITTRNGYHGNTWLLSSMDGSAVDGEGTDWWVTVDAPREAAGAQTVEATTFAAQADDALSRLAAKGHRAAAFYFDTYFCSDGVRTPTQGGLDVVARKIADAGALIIADEVQPGLGRCGTHMWAFQRLGLRPDIVVLGKSLGNGYPIGAVVARAELIDDFYRKERYFNTCAGSQLAAAAGCATLDVIEDEQLLRNAHRVGEKLRAGLQELSSEHSVIRSVRGAGLLLGVDLASPPGSAEPAGAFASRFVTELLDTGVVVGLTGPDRKARTVLKIRPPMVFDEPAVALLLECFRAALNRIDH